MKAVVLIGHGGVPKDFPSEKVSRLRMLEAQRQKNGAAMSDEERDLDHEIRTWQRTPENDPFHFGILAIAERLQARIGDAKLMVAYNEFCGPSIEEATAKLISDGFTNIRFLTTMFTRGGIHSEFEIPEIINHLRKAYPDAILEYSWPFSLDLVTDFLTTQLNAPAL